MSNFKEVNIRDIKENGVSLIADRYMLITAGDEKGYNMMTGSWGFIGEMWHKDVIIPVVRPQRHTFKFLEEQDYFSICFFSGETSKNVHRICGSKSGRDINKTEATGLIPVFDNDTVYFEQADIVLICKKVYVSDINADNFIDKTLDSNYNNDYHRCYMGEILHTFVKE